LRNLGTTTINLQGIRFDNGAPVDDFVFGNESLASGEFIVVTNDVPAFRTRYGSAARVAGAWPGGNLSNGGEQFLLRDPQGNIIHDFNYDDIAPWPLAADGGGSSMEIVNVLADYNDGRNWRASFEAGGTPGFAGIGADSDGDGVPDAYELLFGTDPNNAGSTPRVTVVRNGAGDAMVSWPSTAGRSYRVEYRDDLTSGAWQTLTTIVGIAGSTTFTDPTIPRPSQRFYRVLALP
jgi:hypothetical protein